MLDETNRRREKQVEYNTEHGISPTTIYKTIEEIMSSTAIADAKVSRDARREAAALPKIADAVVRYLTDDQKRDMIEELKQEMRNAAKDLEFERAANLRDEIERLEKKK